MKSKSNAKSIRRVKSSVKNSKSSVNKSKVSRKAVLAKRSKVHRPKHKLKGLEVPSPKDMGIKSKKSLSDYGKVDFDLTLPEPPLPPKSRGKDSFKIGSLFSKHEKKEEAVIPEKFKKDVSLKSPKVVKFDDSDFKFSPDFEEKVTRLLIDSTKKIPDKKKHLVNEYKTHLDNHLKLAKLEIGKADQSEKDTGFFSFLKKEEKPLSAEELIASVEVDKEPVVTNHVKIDIEKIIRSNKLHAEKARDLKETFKSHIREQIESLEFNVNYKITEDQPYFDDLTKMQKTVPVDEIPKYEDFVKSAPKENIFAKKELPVKQVAQSAPSKKSGLFSSFFTESETENPVVDETPKPEEPAVPEPVKQSEKKSQDMPKLPTRKEIEEEEESGDALDQFFKEERKRQSAFKLVIPAEKIRERLEKKKAIDEHERDVSQRELELLFAKEHHSREREDFETHKVKTDSELREIQAHIETLQKQLDLKKLELSEREELIKSREENLKRKEADTKRIIEKEVEINDLKITIDTKSSELKKREQLVASREKTIDEKIKKSETLKAEIERHKKLESFEAELTKKEARINEKQAKLSEKESNLKNKEDELKIKDKMLAEKETVLNSRLKNFKKEKTASLEKKEAELKKIQDALDVRNKELENYDKTLTISRKDLKKEAEKIEDAEFNLLVDEEKLKAKGDIVPETVKFEDIEKIDSIMDLPELKQAEIYRLVSRCRDVLRQKNFNAAKQIYNEIKDRYSKLECPEDEKQIVYNTIRELYDDIRLEML